MIEEGLKIEINSQKYIDDFIKINNLQEVTNPIYLRGNAPTPDGLLSYEIFGFSIEDRKGKMAYIDLKGHYLPPGLALKLKAYDRRLDNILFSTERYILTKDGDLVVDQEEGRTGPEFLYEIWGKVKVKDKTTILTKEVEKTYRASREEIFINKFLVLPAAYRDLATGTKTMSTQVVNDIYSSIISYVQNVNSYTDTFGTIRNITQSRIQGLLVELYEQFINLKIKGQPSKYGFLKKSVISKNPIYTSRSVIAAMDTNTETWEELPIKFEETGVPLAQVCALYFPFIQFHLKRFFDNEFIRGGKYPYMGDDGEVKYTTVLESYDEQYTQDMINRFIKSPTNRFDPVPIPSNSDGKILYMYLTGRFLKDNTTIKRKATWTDILYIVAMQAVQDKNVDTTRFPLESINGQFPGKVVVLTTTRTKPVMIGEKTYLHYPDIESYKYPDNAFIDTVQFSHVKLEIIGGDFDGDMTGEKSRFSKQSNAEADRFISSNAFYLSPSGEFMRNFSKEFIITAYSLTKTDAVLKDINKVAPIISL